MREKYQKKKSEKWPRWEETRRGECLTFKIFRSLKVDLNSRVKMKTLNTDLDEKRRREASAGLGSAADCLSSLLASPHKLDLSTAANREHLHRNNGHFSSDWYPDSIHKYFFCQSIQSYHVIWICNQQFYRFGKKSSFQRLNFIRMILETLHAMNWHLYCVNFTTLICRILAYKLCDIYVYIFRAV